jgi:lysozyme
MPTNRKSRLAAGGAVAGAMFSTIVAFEGMKLVPYKDVVNVWTVCAGETHGVVPGRRYTMDECKRMTLDGLERYAAPVEACITHRPFPDTTFVAFTSLAYNIGHAGFCKSSVARLYNEGRTQEACDAMMRFNRAGGVVWSGLTKRRAAERKLCLQGADL